jgi:putative addiction module killer protein
VEVRRYQTADGTSPLSTWLEALRDGTTRARIIARLDRLQAGFFGDWESVGAGVCELRIDHGPGYRIHYGREGTTVVLLLCGGEKGTQTKEGHQEIVWVAVAHFLINASAACR